MGGNAVTRASSLRIVVLGYVVRGPLGGMVWSNLQYLAGLARLGHDVYFLEESGDYPACYDPLRNVTDTDPTYGLEFATRVFERLGLGTRWAYYDAHTSQWLGPCASRIPELCSATDILLNLCGVNRIRPWFESIPVRVLVDEDPAFTQIRHLTDTAARDEALMHTAFFSFGENIGLTSCSIPQDGIPWRPTRQPVVLDNLAVTPGNEGGKFTTVMLWDSYRVREYAGVRYGMKSDSFQPYLDLPSRSNVRFELAVGGPAAPRQLLQSNGWSLLDPREPTRDPWTYEAYIQGSKAEFGVAKHGYVVSRSGWFSERSVTYMASGRPVVVQDTGFTRWLETGLGVLPFSTRDEALAGIEEVNARYVVHCQMAREVANEYFDARKLLDRLITEAFAFSGPPASGSIGASP